MTLRGVVGGGGRGYHKHSENLSNLSQSLAYEKSHWDHPYMINTHNFGSLWRYRPLLCVSSSLHAGASCHDWLIRSPNLMHAVKRQSVSPQPVSQPSWRIPTNLDVGTGMLCMHIISSNNFLISVVSSICTGNGRTAPCSLKSGEGNYRRGVARPVIGHRLHCNCLSEMTLSLLCVGWIL